MLEILGEQQYWRYWESSNTGDTGRAAVLEILAEHNTGDTGRAAMYVTGHVGIATILEILGDQQCRLMKILGEQQYWSYWEISNAD